MFGLTEALEYMGVKIVKSNHLAELDHTWVSSAATARTKAFGVADTVNSLGAGFNTMNDDGTLGVVGDLGDAKYDFNWARSTGPVVTDGLVDAVDVIQPVKALIWQKSAVCSLRLQGMKVETVKDVRRGTFFTVSSIMAGAGILRPELCGAIQGNYTVA
jgi:hypothetical protein